MSMHRPFTSVAILHDDREPLADRKYPDDHDGAIRRLHEAGVTISLRRRQHASLNSSVEDALFVVRSGLLLASTKLPGKHRQIVSILYAGDLFRTSFLPLGGQTELVAAQPTELSRIRSAALAEMMRTDAPVARCLDFHLADLQARQLLHVAVIGTLTGEERVATLLVDAGLRLGRPLVDGLAIDLPMSRSDIADYLALNADTLSRIMSRLKAAGVVMFPNRSTVIIRNWQSLLKLTPVAGELKAIAHPARR